MRYISASKGTRPLRLATSATLRLHSWQRIALLPPYLTRHIARPPRTFVGASGGRKRKVDRIRCMDSGSNVVRTLYELF